tara:strand:+ start:524 stop:724 length:201 start_codon:yes stop_codon:yes gene_type:complete
MKSKWHNISITTKSFEDLKEIQKSIPIRTSIPQTIEWLIRVGQQQIQSELNYDNNTRRNQKISRSI